MPEKLGPRHWLARAEEARKLADQLDDGEAKWGMLRIASDYEKLAEKVAATAAH